MGDSWRPRTTGVFTSGMSKPHASKPCCAAIRIRSRPLSFSPDGTAAGQLELGRHRPAVEPLDRQPARGRRRRGPGVQPRRALAGLGSEWTHVIGRWEVACSQAFRASYAHLDHAGVGESRLQSGRPSARHDKSCGRAPVGRVSWTDRCRSARNGGSGSKRSLPPVVRREPLDGRPGRRSAELANAARRAPTRSRWVLRNWWRRRRWENVHRMRTDRQGKAVAFLTRNSSTDPVVVLPWPGEPEPGQAVSLGRQHNAAFLAQSPDGRWVASGPFHGTHVKVWEASSGHGGVVAARIDRFGGVQSLRPLVRPQRGGRISHLSGRVLGAAASAAVRWPDPVRQHGFQPRRALAGRRRRRSAGEAAGHGDLDGAGDADASHADFA